MELILLRDIKGLGKEGDAVKAKDGYARNFLIPRRLALESSPGAIKAIEAKRKKAAGEVEKEKGKLEELAKRISQVSLTIPMESGVNDALFGSVTTDAISRALGEESLNVDKKSITLKEPIKKLGIYNVDIKLHPEIKANLRIWIVKK
jgi:large subunit ribosomal protein L9